MGLSTSLDKRTGVWIASLKGELDYNECSSLRMTVDRILKEMPPAAVVDLAGVEYIDSSGLGLLLSLSKAYGASGGRLVLVTNESTENVLNLTRLSPMFVRAASLDEALTMIGLPTG